MNHVDKVMVMLAATGILSFVGNPVCNTCKKTGHCFATNWKILLFESGYFTRTLIALATFGSMVEQMMIA